MPVHSVAKGNVFWITIDNQKRKNAISEPMYSEICSAMDEANENDDIIFTVLTGAGDFYSSGNDFSPSEDHGRQSDPDFEGGYSRWMKRLIAHTKIIIALVNGPAIGIACTTLAMCDYVVCSSSAYFQTPFPMIGVTPEGGSSDTFPKIMGTSNANELLLFGMKMDAETALRRGFVSQVFPKEQFKAKTEEMLANFSKLPKHSLLASKELVRGRPWRKERLAVHMEEFNVLQKIIVSEESMNLIMNRFAKSKM